MQLQDHLPSGLQEECWRSAERWCTWISVEFRSEPAVEKGLQECWGSAHRWLTSISVTIRLDQPGQRALHQCLGSAQRWLDLQYNDIGPAVAETFAGVLPHCASLAHLDLSENEIGNVGAKSFAGVLAQCPALAHLNLNCNQIGAVGKGRLRASWRGKGSCLVLGW